MVAAANYFPSCLHPTACRSSCLTRPWFQGSYCELVATLGTDTSLHYLSVMHKNPHKLSCNEATMMAFVAISLLILTLLHSVWAKCSKTP